MEATAVMMRMGKKAAKAEFLLFAVALPALAFLNHMYSSCSKVWYQRMRQAEIGIALSNYSLSEPSWIHPELPKYKPEATQRFRD